MRHILVVFLFCLANTAWSQTQTYTSTGSFTVPDGVTSVIVECWGGGGAGGGNTSSNDGGGGGGGGAYAKSTISVTPGTAYSVTVGTGPNGGSGNGSSGGDSWFINASTVMAKGGSGGSTVSGGNPGNGGAGGSSALSVGTTKFAGGTGGTGRNNNSGQGGPGGSSAGTSAIGTSGAGTWSTVTAAAAPSGGGIGGNGGTSGNDGSNGGTPGGGGGGAGDNNSTGGDGARGQVIITWTCSNTLTSGAGSNIQSLCKNSSITAITYSIVGATGAGVSGLPTGVTGTYSSGVFTISGAPSVTGTFNYTVTPTGSCTSSTSTGTITVNGPTANVGSALSSICQNGTSGLLGGSVSGTATGGTWSDGAIGGAFNPNATTLNGTYSPPSGFSGTVVLTLTSSGGSCGTASASKNLTVVAQPTASGSGGSQTICAGGSATVSGISASNGTISWTENGAGSITSGGATVSPTYTSQAGDAGNTVTLTMTVTGNPCTVANATYTVLVNALPSISVSPASPNVCLGSGVSLTVSGASTYLWSPAGSLSASTGATVIASPSVNTTYTVTGTDANSCTKTSTVTVTIIPAPSAVTVTPSSTTICSGGSVSLAASGGPLVSTVTSGTGSSTTSSNTSSSTLGPNPLQNYYGGMKQQTMWRASELTALGLISGSKINSITINLAAAGTTYALLNYRVKYQLSPSITSLSTTPITTGWATIYGPQSYTPNVGLNTFTFTSPITWDGSSSLILEFNFSNNNTGSTGTLNTATFNTGIGYTATNFYRADNVTAASVDAFSSTVNFSYSSRNNVQFNITQPVTYAWLPATGLNTTSGTPVIATPSVSTTYTVSGTLSNGCASTATSVVNIDPAISISFSQSDVSCNGGSNGSATASPSGGNGSYTAYLWSDGQTTSTATGLIAGTYSVTVTDGIGCTASNSVTITQPAALVASCSVVSNVSCNGGTNGAADVTASGGTAPYTGTGSFTGLAAGSYTYNISDANGCTASCSVTISEPAALVATCSVVANVSCNGGTDGAADVTASGGTTPYTGTGSFTGLAAGSYTYNISDANGCTASCTVTITEPAVLSASCSVASNVSCNGGADGVVTVTGSGGTAPYSVSPSPNGLTAGSYTFTITDANGCTTTCSETITEPTVLSASCSWVSDASCNGGSDGSASVSATGGTAPYSGTGLIAGLSAGTQTLTVTDANGCTATCSVTINEPTALVATCSVVSHVSCNGGTDGAADVIASGGTSPYTGTGSFTGLAAGAYTYNISDANGCTASCSVTITEPAALVATCSVVANVSCNGGTDGAADVSASGGTAPYTGTGSFTGLAAGSYTYNISDANGCTASCSVTITEPAVLVATCSVVSHVSCNGGTDGAADVSASGGTAPYTGTGSFTGLAAGSYTYNISDANGCTASCSVTITEPTVLLASCTFVSDVTCNGGADGSASVSASGGTAPYSGTGLITGLSAGTQTLTVTDANGCTATCSVTISEPAALVATCSIVSHVSCNGGTDGAADVTASGGTAPYTGTGSFTGLAAGSYTYNVSDANGCTASCSVTITEPAALVATCSVVSHVSCNGGTDGAADVSASGGTAPYTGTGSFTGLAAGSYTYNISDANGCTASCSVTITEPAALVATCSVVSHVSCNGGTDGAADVTASGGTAPYTGTGSFTGLAAGTYTYNVSDANGCTASCSVTITEPAVLLASCTFVSDVTCNGGSDGSASVSASGGTAPYTGTGLITGLSAGTQTLTVTDANGCTTTCSVTISEPAALVASCSVVSHVSCNGGTDGAADVSASGGTAPYTGTGSFTGLAAGTYTYNVSDANGCTASCSVTITEPAALVATCSVVSHVSCNGGTDSAADVIV
ncbi:MAG: SprB repeat-containing protein [Bacteroidetes bacterium]|nr:SprB repeat-containing protein [Bacteroidota bacterium]